MEESHISGAVLQHNEFLHLNLNLNLKGCLFEVCILILLYYLEQILAGVTY